MKSTIVDFEPRIVIKPDTTTGIMKYDIDNAYPQRMIMRMQGSGITQSCVRLLAKYIRGLGFEDAIFYKSICNRKKWTFDKLLRAVSKDFALHRGFAIHVNYNLLYEISEMSFVPFENIRLAEEDDNEYTGKVKLYSDWGKQKRRHIDTKKIKTIHLYNPDPDVIAAQIKEAEGIDNYLGQVLYFTDDCESYPLSTIDPIEMDCETDAEVKFFKNRTVTTGFIQQHLWVDKVKPENDKQEKEHIENIKSFQGSRQSSKIIRIQVDRDEEVPDIKPFDSNIDDKLFAYTESSTEMAIVRNFGTPPILLAINTPGALGDKNDRAGAENTYSDITKDDRLLMESVFSELFQHWHDQSMNSAGNFSITPIGSVVKTLDKTQLKDILIDTTLLPAQKIEILVHLFGFTKEIATKLVTPTTDAVS